jgi:hypothetical protein
LPVFNQGQGELLRRQSALALEAASLARDAVLLRARARQAVVVADNAALRAAQIEAQMLPPLARLVDEMERRLNGMLVFPSRVFVARREFLQARRQETEALRDAWLTRIDVEQLRQGSTPSSMSTMSMTSGTSAATSSSSSASTKGHD